jgi:membrane-associated phospholipid phosphatase
VIADADDPAARVHAGPGTSGTADVRWGRRRAALVLVPLAAFALLLADLVWHGPVTSMDVAVNHWLALHRTDVASALLIATTRLHSTPGVELLLLVAALLLALGRQWREALWLVSCVQGAMLLNVAVKNLVQRPRPELDQPMVHLATFSFPSGHALASTVLWGCIVLLVSRGRFDLRAAVWAVLAAATVMLTCLSRIYLGAHYLSDVLAGVLEGLFWLNLCAWSFRKVLAAAHQKADAKSAMKQSS